MNAPRKDDQEQREDAAIGRTFRVWAEEMLDKFKFHLVITLLASLAGWGSREMHFISAQQPQFITAEEAHEIINGNKQLHRDMVEVKVTSQAIVDSLPEQERLRAKGLIADRMAVVHLADERTSQ